MKKIDIEEYAHGRQFYMSKNMDEFVFMKEMAEVLKLDAEFHYDAEYRLCFMLIYKEDYEKLKDRMVSKKKRRKR